MTYDDKLKRLEGFNHIIDDGECTDHGYFLPKQPVKVSYPVIWPKVEYVSVPTSELVEVLKRSSVRQGLELEKMFGSRK